VDFRIDFERLKRDVLELGAIGRTAEGGISRPSFSRADLEAREWLKERIQAAGLAYRVDGAGNIFGRLGDREPVVMAGSHIDSVINGGMFDGPAGVLPALECLRRIREEGLQLSRALEVAAFTDEEGNLVGDFLGSRAFTGTLRREILEEGVTQFGVPLEEILQNTDFTIESILEASEDRPQIDAFLELHIEQGQTLETEGKSIGIVDCIAGKNHWSCRFTGEPGHSGTVPLELRRDAFLGLADFALKATQYVATHHYGSLVTVGKARLHPGAFSIVAGAAEFSLDFRSTSPDAMERIRGTLLEMAEDTAATRGLSFSSQVVDATPPKETSGRLQTLLQSTCDRLGYSWMNMPSGAGHDAQILTEVCDSALIFIPCRDGVSHAPEESIRWEDLETGANLLLHALVELAR
jgi:N-carbamoyl-L-amino-acid hydrolase